MVHQTSGKLLASEVELANTYWRRLRGLMFRRRFEKDRALLFKFPKPSRYSVHTFFVRFQIDLIYLDSSFTVVEIRKQLKPWRMHRPKTTANYLIELPAGNAARLGVKVGDKISLEKSSSKKFHSSRGKFFEKNPL